jgi:hypothetical protein
MTIYAGRYGPEGIEYPDGTHAVNRAVTVYVIDGDTPAVLFTNRDRTEIADNPVYTDDLGNLVFWTNPGDYLCEVDEGHQFIVQVSKDPFESAEEGSVDLEINRVAAITLSGHKLVTTNDDGTVRYADASDLDDCLRPIWLTTSAWLEGALTTLTVQGIVVEPTWNWTPGSLIWLGLNGQLTQTIPPEAAFVRRVAEVIEPTIISFRPEMPIVQIGA